MNEPIHVNDAAFEKAVLKSPLPVVVDFWAPWCMPCRMVAPYLETLAKEYEGRLIVAEVNTDEDSEWAVRYGVRGIPTLLFVRDGKIVDQQVGVAPLATLREMVEKLIAEAKPVEKVQ